MGNQELNKDPKTMTFTGERFVPGLYGNIALEHLQRYQLACQIVADKDVLDIASGEGYGSAMLARSARKVFGVDIAEDVIAYAQATYPGENIEFRVGSCSAIPLDDASVDVVVSFETIEHHDGHEAMMQEIKRVLRPGGVLVVSSPDKLEYSDKVQFTNEYHVKELYRDEFEDLLSSYFKHHSIYGQRVVYGAAVVGENDRHPMEIRRFAGGALGEERGLAHAVYLIAVASDAELPHFSGGLLEQPIDETEVMQGWRESVEQRDREADALRKNIAALGRNIEALREETAELQRSHSERETEAAALRQALGEASAERDGARAQLEAVGAELAAIRRSRTWKATAPIRHGTTFLRRAVGGQLRRVPLTDGRPGGESEAPDLGPGPGAASGAASAVMRRTRASVYGRARTIYRRLPLSAVQKQRLKTLVFRSFGFLFVSSDAYERWKVTRRTPVRKWESKPATVPAAPVDHAALPTADGVWEWRDYHAVRGEIARVKERRLRREVPSVPALIDTGREPYDAVAARVALPAPGADPDVSIIVPVFNNLRMTLECLLSIARHTGNQAAFEVIVIDDGSTDETAQIVGSIDNVRFVQNETNLGFIKACNRALDYVRGGYVLYLNNDVQVMPSWLDALLNTFAQCPDAGAAGPRFVYPSGYLQEAGAALRVDGSSDMIGLNENPSEARYSYLRRVDYVSGACLMVKAALARELGGFSEEFLPCYCEDSDLGLRIRQAGYQVYYNPSATVVHHLSKTTDAIDRGFKLRTVAKNLVKLQRKWADFLDRSVTPKVIVFYLPQFHPIPENDKWWQEGFTEWSNVTKARPNFVGHYQPRLPADLGYYDLRLPEVLERQAELARRYGVGGFCFYYYWFAGRRLLERPIERMLESGRPDFPFCLCWANENWTRRWDGLDQEVLCDQAHSPDDDEAVIQDLIRYFRDSRYIRIDGRPLLLVYRVTLFPDFLETARRWRAVCRAEGIGEIYIAMVESMEMVESKVHPREYGCDAGVEFPPQGLAEAKAPEGAVINPNFKGSVADYRDVAVRFAAREQPVYTRFPGVMPGWDNTARRQNDSFCFDHASPGAFQAWLEEALEQARLQHCGDERLVFVNAWNEWAEGAYLEPDRRFGHTFLEAVKNALEAQRFVTKGRY